MAIGLNALTSGQDETAGTSATTASIAPAANALVLLAVQSEKAEPAPSVPSISGGGMTSWTQVRTFAWDNAGTSRTLTLFRSLQASPGSGTVTIDFGAESQDLIQWSIIEFTGVDTTGTNGSGAVVQDAQNPATVGSGTRIDVSLSAFSDGGNVTYSVAGKESPGAGDYLTPEAELTSIHNVIDSGNSAQMQSVWKNGEPTDSTVTFGPWATSRRRGGFAIEVAVSTVTVQQLAATANQAAHLTGQAAVTTEIASVVGASATTKAHVTTGLVFRPDGDLLTTGWDTAPTASQSLYAQIDEGVPDSTDYIYPTG